MQIENFQMIMHLTAAIPGGDPEDIWGHDAGFVNFVR